MKCQSCGATLNDTDGSCPYCGSKVFKEKPKPSVVLLAEAVDNAIRESKERYARIQMERKKRGGRLSTMFSDYADDGLEDDTDKVVAEVIKNFPAPSEKNDLIELIMALKQKTKGDPDSEITNAYYGKYKECLEKAAYLYPNDREVYRVLRSNRLKGLHKLNPKSRVIVYILLMFVAGLFLMFLMYLLY